MQSNMIPVRIVGPGTQPPEEVELEYFAMPQGMNTFEMPRVPEHADARAMAESRELLAAFLAQLATWDPASRLPAPQVPEWRVPAATGLQEFLSRCVPAIYDIRADDRRLRALLGLPPAERTAGFDRLRRDYPTRREFSSTRIRLTRGTTMRATPFRELGFTL